MLNAFRHHWNLHAQTTRRRAESLPSAQRLSASLESSRVKAVPSLLVLRVLNAFRHHWNLHTGGVASYTISFTLCSTPFGIIGIFTTVMLSQIATMIMCSTPFGIIGIFTVHAGRRKDPNYCAQRLSASLESSRRRQLTRRHGCLSAQRLSASLESSRSRPSGVGIPTRVLNAFRHHWNLHLACFLILHSQTCAQRLSASLESSLMPNLPNDCIHLCAQRLSASLESSRRHSAENFCTKLSAQRLSASLESSLSKNFILQIGHKVLNAFRHHWNLHSRLASLSARSACAQRLSASLESSQNAPSVACRSKGSAQRLSASLESSHAKRKPL